MISDTRNVTLIGKWISEFCERKVLSRILSKGKRKTVWVLITSLIARYRYLTLQ